MHLLDIGLDGRLDGRFQLLPTVPFIPHVAQRRRGAAGLVGSVHLTVSVRPRHDEAVHEIADGFPSRYAG